ncbi:MAG: hypothetical protein C0597_07185 [Marinilabiliales bacterium]|nr:MAG: hypothetical protein C0597_07185 [Marinilabiliales bacterium]
MKSLLFTSLLILFYPFINIGQINYKGIPNFYDELKQEIPIEVLPEVNVRKLESEDRQENSRLKKMRYADMIDVDISPETHGIWNVIEDEKIWYMSIKSSGAFSLSLIFDQFRLPVGAKLYIYSVDKQHVRGAFTYKNNKLSYILPIAPIRGDEIILEYHEPYNVDFSGELHISEVAHDYKNIFNYLSKEEKGFGDSGDCNININCDEDELWQLLKHSVCKITYNGWLCTGALINNTKEDSYPYLLTANHCINNNYDASVAMFYFNYESPECINQDGILDQVISGSSIVATPPEKTIDFSLLELSSEPPPGYKPYFAGWSRDISNPSSVISLHHPRGDIKKITKSLDGAETGDYGEGYNLDAHWWIDQWDSGTTEGGSSGSPLFDQNGRIIGDLTGGEANCEYNYNDYYQQLYHSWQDFADPEDQLKTWLDPLNLGVITLNGYLPYDTIPTKLRASFKDTIITLAWNHVEDTAKILHYYVYRNSVKLDSVKASEYTDTLAFKSTLYKYHVTAKYIMPIDYESKQSNTVFIRTMNAIGLPFTETFEDGFIPDNWYEERTNDTVGWQYTSGGFDGILDTAFEGSLNAYFYNDYGESSKLVLPKFEFSAYTNLKLTFYMHMQEFNNDVHNLRILYSEADSLEWKILKTYDTSIEEWVKREIPLPNLSDNYKIAFEGVGLRGFGICIDSIAIIEDGEYINPTILVDKTIICISDSIEYSTNLDNTYKLLWNFGSSAMPSKAIGEGPHWVKYVSSGIKSAELIVDDTYSSNDYDVAVVYELPDVPTFTNNGNTLISSADVGNQWYFNGSPILDATDKTYVIENDGNYFVEVANSFNCVSASEEQYMMAIDIDDFEYENSIVGLKVYPNPNRGQFTIEAEFINSDKFYYKIIDLTGKIMQFGTLDTDKQNQIIDFKNSKYGIYYIQIYSTNKYYTSKLFIKK